MSRLRKALAGSRERVRLESFARLALAHARAHRGEVALAYDLGVSSVSYGEFALFCLVARLLQTWGAYTRIVVLDEQVRWDTTPEMLARVDQFPEVAAAYCLPGRWELRRGGRGELDGLPLASPERDLRLGKATYSWSWPMLESAMCVYPSSARERFLLRASDVAAALGLDLPERPYVAVGVRAASEYDVGRDLGRTECTRIAEMCRDVLPYHDLLVVSDVRGTEKIRPWLEGAVFAQDIVKGFAAHTALALGGSCYVQIRGGGIATGAIWSHTPWFVASAHYHSPRYDALQGDARIHPRWAPTPSVWCANDDAAWAIMLGDFLAAVRDGIPT